MRALFTSLFAAMVAVAALPAAERIVTCDIPENLELINPFGQMAGTMQVEVHRVAERTRQTIVYFPVWFHYTNDMAARRSHATLERWARLSVDGTNQLHENSNTNVRFVFAEISQVDIWESGDGSTDLAEFKSSYPCDQRFRVLMAYSTGGVAHEISGDPSPCMNLRSSLPMSLLLNPIFGNPDELAFDRNGWILAHATGHNFGAGHHYDASVGGCQPGNVGCGKCLTGAATLLSDGEPLDTVMSICGEKQVIQHFSDPTVYVNGESLGVEGRADMVSFLYRRAQDYSAYVEHVIDETQPPPYPSWLSHANLPGFEVQVRIVGESERQGAVESQCIPETLCVSGAVAGRSEVFVRVVGPKPNGMLWPTLVKFSTSQVEVWIRQLATGTIQYYLLPGASPGVDELLGLFDRDGFAP